jgi:hypothetical protein
MNIKEHIARRLCPSLTQKADRYDHLITHLRDDIWWLGEFPEIQGAMWRIVAMDADTWRPLGTPPIAKQSLNINDYRERLRRGIPEITPLTEAKSAAPPPAQSAPEGDG